MLIEPNITRSVFVVVGTSKQAIKITQVLQLSQSFPVLNIGNDCWIEKRPKIVSIELFLVPNSCDCRSCPLNNNIVANKIKRVAIYDVPNDQVAFQLMQKGIVGVFYLNDPIEVISKGIRLMLNNTAWPPGRRHRAPWHRPPGPAHRPPMQMI